MLSIKATENLAGVEISGSFDDLNKLYDALTNLTGDEMSYDGYYQNAMYVSGLCYDIRHAYQGERETTQSLYGEKHYCFKWVWTDIIFIYAVLEDFINISQSSKCYLRQEGAEKMFFDPGMRDVLLDRLPDDIALVQYFRELIKNELQRVLDEKRFKAIFRKVCNGYDMRSFRNYRTQMIAILSVKYLKRSPDKRKSYLATLTEKIFFDNYDYYVLAQDVEDYAKEYGVDPSEIELEGMQYPEITEW